MGDRVCPPAVAVRPARAARRAVLALAAFGGLLLAPVPAAATPAPPSAAAPPLTGQALGPDRQPSCDAVVAALPKRARLAQRLMVGVDGSDPAATAQTVRSTQVGGIFIGGNATDLLRNQSLREVHAMARIPLAVAVDDEGGRVQRIDELDGTLPSARAMSAMDPLRVRELGRDRGRELAGYGVTINFAPTVDVSKQRSGAVIGDRSFGNDPEQVVRYAGAFAQGQREAGVFTVLKHFPGHGHADGDSHRGRVSTPPLDQLRRDDLRPYAELVGPGGPLAGAAGDARTGVMVGHLDVPGLTTDLPSSLTPAVYTLLREDYGFDGVVFTDDLGAMKAVTGRFDLPEAVERALAAGADVALSSTGGRVDQVLDRLDQALAAGRLDPAANDRATARVLQAKGVCSSRS
jgi:beta-N-acetylhexosaminidase